MLAFCLDLLHQLINNFDVSDMISVIMLSGILLVAFWPKRIIIRW